MQIIKKKPWTLVFGHQPIYSNGTHGDVNLLTRRHLDWFLEGRVDMHFAGHNHHLSHLQKESSSTDYVISGSGGAHYRSVNERKN